MSDGDTSTSTRTNGALNDVLGTASGPGGYPDTHRGAHLVGVMRDGAPLYYDPDEHRRFEAAPDVDPGTAFEWATSEPLDDDTAVSDLVEAIEDGLGWYSLSEYGRKRVPDDVDVDVDAE